MLYRRLVRPLLFRLDAEVVHELTLEALARCEAPLRRAGRPLRVRDPRLEQRLLGLTFPNPVGLAAGFDKRGRAAPAWGHLGFGFVEIGTVTALAQAGNPPPRLFRLPADAALVNRMGFNNDGAARTAERLAEWERRSPGRRIPWCVNVGRSRRADPADAPADYAASVARLWPHADLLVVNVSSPNTPGLRDLQGRAQLEEVLVAVGEANRRAAAAAGACPRPVLVKIAPDLTPAQVDDVLALSDGPLLDGLVIANTTTAREGLVSPPALAARPGGLSGRPLRARSTALIRHAAAARPGLPIVGVGGVFTADDAWEKLRAGARLVQVWTGLVYEGPAIARRINRGLLRRMAREGLANVGEVAHA